MKSQITNTNNSGTSGAWNINKNTDVSDSSLENINNPDLKKADSGIKTETTKKSDSPAAIVTGASSGIGKEISKVLCEMGYKVYGLGRTFAEEKTEDKRDNPEKVALEENLKITENENPKITENESPKITENESPNNRIIKISCDLSDTNNTLQIIKKIKKENTVTILVNCAGVGYYGLHEEINYKNIQEMVRTNLELPMILSSELLRDLKKTKGYIINISSITAENSNPHGCAYGATKAGLSSFSKSLFDEQRKYGIKVVNIQPDMTRTNLYRNADFRESDNEAAFLYPEEVAEAVRQVLSCRDGMVVTEITLRPQLHQIKKNKK
ncbi:MAG: SDR family oxidoreductase [Lachnospiraceae bacterium]|nr:SDR family oxidoreductase [Lachnospiraceae bacterium]